LEAKCFRLSRSKTEYIKCDFSATTQEEGPYLFSFSTQERHISLLGIDVPKNGDIDEDVSHRIKAAG
jgi:hypothetical protein